MAWLFQDPRQKKKLGDKCPWSVGFYDQEGRRKREKAGPARSSAEKLAHRIEEQIQAGTYASTRKRSWSDFRAEFEARSVSRKADATREAYRYA